MILYHGSEKIIEKPVFGAGKRNNDYGSGFYCTEDYELAMEWAVDENRDGFVNSYDFNLESTNMRILDLSNGYSVLSWIAILLENRNFDVSSPIAREAKKYILDNFAPSYQEYDVIKGYRADDSYFSFARDFLNNTISIEQLGAAMKYGNLGEQIVIKSERAFSELLFSRAFEADSSVWYSKKNRRDQHARQQYYDIDKNKFNRNDIYVYNILEQEMTIDDIRI